MTVSEQLADLADQVDGSLSVQHANARNLLTMAAAELAAAPPALDIAIGRLLSAYAARLAERYTIREGLTVSFAESTAAKLGSLAASAQVLVAAGEGTATLWVDDGPVRLDISAADLVAHAAAYTLAFSQRLAWVSAKRQEIEAAEDPLAVSLD